MRHHGPGTNPIQYLSPLEIYGGLGARARARFTRLGLEPRNLGLEGRGELAHRRRGAGYDGPPYGHVGLHGAVVTVRTLAPSGFVDPSQEAAFAAALLNIAAVAINERVYDDKKLKHGIDNALSDTRFSDSRG